MSKTFLTELYNRALQSNGYIYLETTKFETVKNIKEIINHPSFEVKYSESYSKVKGIQFSCLITMINYQSLVNVIYLRKLITDYLKKNKQINTEEVILLPRLASHNTTITTLDSSLINMFKLDTNYQKTSEKNKEFLTHFFEPKKLKDIIGLVNYCLKLYDQDQINISDLCHIQKEN